MKIIRHPQKKDWKDVLARPFFDTALETDAVRKILDHVRENGDEALRSYSRLFDKVEIKEFAVSENEFAEAEQRISQELKNSIQIAKANIEKFHAAQRAESDVVETTPGVFCWRRSVAIEKIGLYVPAGTAPLFSTVLMLGVPAKLAGCREIVLCSPPATDGKVADAILYAARVCGIDKMFKIGGAQAIGALAYGTETVPKVYKIFGPGNRFVTCAKQIVSQMDTAIDMPAGPSEVAVLADETCVPKFVAADLLSQAEHGVDSQVLLVTTSEKVIEKTLAEIETQLAALPRKEIAERSLAASKAILTASIDEAIDIANEYAAEHLILAVADAENIADKIVNAGSVFIGNYSCESAGDYASGTNHTLPTGGFARSFSGVSLDSFVKKITFQKLTEDGIRNLGPAIETMAAAEGLDAHKNAISVRLSGING
ncbi:MAG TPA: histidinol dehydrogenase [Pyrinomonadaceae bacterium]|jgi:histidinol dehydrogenase|nr:histidinol dehydrogenase [Pyrinomonadaceae bacterium]